MKPPIGAVVDAFRDLAMHGRECDVCPDGLDLLRGIPDQPAAVYDRLCAEGQALFATWDAAKRGLVEEPGPADAMLASVRRVRELFALEGLDDAEADTRIRALARVPPNAFTRLLELSQEERLGEVRALEAALRHGHELVWVAVVGVSEADRRPLYRWACGCGRVTGRDYFKIPDALAGFARHAAGRALAAGVAADGADVGAVQPQTERQCEGCEIRFVAEWPKQRFHSNACKQRAYRGRQATLLPTED